jgi:hypothetical protein
MGNFEAFAEPESQGSAVRRGEAHGLGRVDFAVS